VFEYLAIRRGKMEVHMRLLRILSIGVLICMTTLAGMIVFGTAKTSRPVQSIMDPFRSVDYTDLPAPKRYTARDGAALSYREYRGVAPPAPAKRS
jgi:hypothetical protein